MALSELMYPLEYMFPIIPLLPACMNGSETLLLAPTPYIIGITSSFFAFKNHVRIPADVWLVDLDASKLIPPDFNNQLPDLPETDGKIFRAHLQQAMVSLSTDLMPIHDLDSINSDEVLNRLNAMHSNLQSNLAHTVPQIVFGNDVDSVDVAIRCSVVKFLTCDNVLGNHAQFCRTLRLYPSPVVALQASYFLNYLPNKSSFATALVDCQSLEFFGEWQLSPSTTSYLKIMNGVIDPQIIGDKLRWFSTQLTPIQYQIYDPMASLSLPMNIPGNAKHGDQKTPNSSLVGSDSDEDRTSNTSSNEYNRNENDSISEAGDEKRSNEQSSIQGATKTSDLKIPHLANAQKSSDFQSEEEVDGSEDKSSIHVNVKKHTAVFNKSRANSDNYRGGSESMSERSLHDTTLQNYQTPSSPTGSICSDTGSTVSADIARLFRKSKSIKKASSSDTSSKLTSPFLSRRLSGSKLTPLNSPTISNDRKAAIIASVENQHFLRDAARKVMGGTTLGWVDMRRLKKLMVSEANRCVILNQLIYHNNTSDKIDGPYIEDTCITRKVFNAMLELMKAILTGYEDAMNKYTSDGMASVFLFIEVIYTYYCGKQVNYTKQLLKEASADTSRKSSTDNTTDSSFDSKNQSITSETSDSKRDCGISSHGNITQTIMEVERKSIKQNIPNSLSSDNESSSNEYVVIDTVNDPKSKDSKNATSSKVPGEVNSRTNSMSEKNISTSMDRLNVNSRQSSAENVNDRLLVAKGKLTLQDSTESCDSLGSTPSLEIYDIPASPTALWSRYTRHRLKINHASFLKNKNSIDSDSSDREGFREISKEMSNALRKSGPKSRISNGYRYRGKLIQLQPKTDVGRRYLFEGFTAKDRSLLWDRMEFWESAYLDAVTAERDTIGMNERSSELIDRYFSLSQPERRRLEEEEDYVLTVMLYNMVAFMVALGVNKQSIKSKIRRLLGKSHVGITHSQYVNDVLDVMDSLKGNDIDLKAWPSRTYRKSTYVVRAGTDKLDDFYFMEICDDGIMLRSGVGVIIQRWWYEKIVHISFSPKVKVLCIWCKEGKDTALHKFYSKKCRKLYKSITESMQRAALRQSFTSNIEGGQEGEGLYEISDLDTNQTGHLEITMDGIDITLESKMKHIDLRFVKNCGTQGDVFYFDEYVNESELVRHRFGSPVCKKICYTVLSMFSFIAASTNNTPVLSESSSLQPSPLGSPRVGSPHTSIGSNLNLMTGKV
ncbi:uncharacterized protein TRIADDRAFT_51823 [Trichoplax adhaerens]|uniref:UDENN domain-containing protein n=1 Tax=Trichoplax adhaerens TaxID=10228 RepID=B3RKZ6_TRIAD|nr:hypothetical protein TRIADDRAFT_51823 [Trichoplax adhaerens]EDV29461.1 hypothetical protein TRIADDRAFT_51823 [Trichoplax adhaerens]|eukprot:XP_002108663.1 hypothetical protein TRIADDRAFT_51823 [Trichoplax adhaerens]